jgi:type I restriction enzyme S subunit
MNVSGATGSHTRAKTDNIISQYVPLPPLAEQHRIVQKIEELFTDLDAGVQELEKAKTQIKSYRQAVLKAAFEGKLVSTEDELAEKEKQSYETAYELLEQIMEKKRKNIENRKCDCDNLHGPDINSLPNLPKGWCWTNLEQLKSFSLYGPRFSSKDYLEEGYLVLRTSDISESGKVDVNSAPKLNLSRETFLKYKIEIGDLLITRSGSLGTLAVFNDKVEAIPGAYLIQYRLVSNSIMSWYIFHFLKSPIGQKRLLLGGAGVGRPNLNAPTIEAIEIPLPPLAEQNRIISEIERRFSVIDQIEKTIDQSLVQAEKLRQSILKKAFEGKLVPQDPNDEPASVLLERIKQEKGRAESRKKPEKKTKVKVETIMEVSGKTKQAELF